MLDIIIDIDEFTNAEDPNSATRITKHIETKASVANREILAIGGLITKRVDITKTRLPILGDIPLLGWIFKNENKITQNSNLLVLISPQTIQPKIEGGSGTYTNRKADYSRKTLRATEENVAERDPIHRWFFKEKDAQTKPLDDFMSQKFHAKREDTSTDIFYKSKVEQIEKKHSLYTQTPSQKVSQRAPKRSLTNFIQSNQEETGA